MGRGQIQRYEQRALSPQAVGVPGENRTAQILGQGLQQLSSALNKRNEEKASIAATSKLGDFDLDYTRMKEDLRVQHFNDPDKYPEALRENAQKLKERYTKGMSGTEAKYFSDLSSRYMMKEASESVKWSINREKQQIVGDINKGYSNLVLKAEMDLTPGGLKAILDGEEGNDLTIPAQNQKASSMLNEKEIQALTTSTRKQVVQNGMDARIVANPATTYQALAAGEYDGILQASEIKTFMTSAYKTMKNQAELENYRTLMSSAVELSSLTEALNAGDAGIGDINRAITWAKMNENRVDSVTQEPVVSKKYVEGLQRLRNIAINQDFRSSGVKDADEVAFREDFDPRWNKFITSKNAKGANGKLTPKDYDDVIGLYADLLGALSDRKIDSATYDKKKKILDNINKNRLDPTGETTTLTEAFQKAGKYHWWDNPRDIYSEGYEIIDRYVQKERPDLDEKNKASLKDELLMAYTTRVNQLSPEQRKDKEKYAAEILQGVGDTRGVLQQFEIFRTPDGKVLRPGQRISYGDKGVQGVFLGVNPRTGKYKIAVSDNLTKELER